MEILRTFVAIALLLGCFFMLTTYAGLGLMHYNSVGAWHWLIAITMSITVVSISIGLGFWFGRNWE